MQQLLIGAKAIKEAISHMPVGEEFEACFECSAEENSRFAVLVICIDDFEKKLEDLGREIISNTVVRLARIVDGLSKTRPIMWGRLDQERFACLCSDMDEAGAMALAREVQQRFAVPCEETLSIGIGVYPFGPFEKMSTLSNAQKALDHAAFFGSNTITAFDAISLNISGDKLYQRGDIDGAIEEFQRALVIDPENVNVYNSLGVCHSVQGNFELAIHAYETALRLDPGDVMATYNLGLAQLKQGKCHKALPLFLDAHRLDGDHPDIAYQVGICYHEMGQTDTAIEYLEKAVQNKPKGAHVFRALGDCYLDREKLREATKAYEKAVRYHPTDTKSLSTLGYLYGALGENLEIAIVLARESTAIDPYNGLYRYRLGKLYLQNGEYKKALEQFKKATELGQDCQELIDEAENAVHTSVDM